MKDRKLAPIALLGLLALACAGPLVGCGGGANSASAKEPASKAEGSAVGEEPGEADAKKQRQAAEAQTRKREAAETAELKRKQEAAARQAAAAPATTKKHGKGKAKGKANHASGKHTKKTAKSHTGKPGASETPAEQAARRQFAKEEAEELARFRKHQHEEAGGH